MARRNAYKPLQEPDLASLPSPTDDMLGGLTNPATLTKMSRGQVDSLLSPAPVGNEPLKLSKSAQQGLDMLAKNISSAETFAAEQEKARLKQEAELDKQHAELMKRNRKEVEARVKAIEKANKKAAEEGITGGAGPGGTFLSHIEAEDLANNPEWQSTVSSIERRDAAKLRMAKLAESLKQRGYSQEVIDEEVREGMREVEKHIKAYRDKMHEDDTGFFDVVLGGGAIVGHRLAQSVAGILGAHDFVRDREEDVAKIKAWMSTEYQLDAANNEYVGRRAAERAAGRNNSALLGILDEYGSTFADMISEDETDIGAALIDQWGYFAVGGAATKGISALGKAAGLGGRATVAATAAGAATQSAVTRLGSKLASAVTNPNVVGASVSSGGLVGLDAAGGAYDAVQAVSFEELSKNYSAQIGDENWKTLVDKYNGDEQAIKDHIATDAARKAGALGFGLGVMTGATGVDSMVANLFGRKAVGQRGAAALAVGNRITQAAVGAATETLEEGLTQVVSNVGSQPATGKPLTEGVGGAAALGTLIGGGSSSAVQVVGAVADARSGQTSGKARYDATGAAVNPDNFVEGGTLNFGAYQAAVGEQFQRMAKEGLDREQSPEEIAAEQQMVYDDFIDDAAKWKSFSPEQKARLQEYLAKDWGVNTNDYARYTTPDAEAAFLSGDYAAVQSLGSAELTHAYRLYSNTDTHFVPDNMRDYYAAVGDIIVAMSQQPRARTTRERQLQFKQVYNERVLNNDKLSPGFKSSIAAFGATYLGASPRRMTNEEQAHWDGLNAQAEQAKRNQEAQQNGTTQQTQEAGQGNGSADPQGGGLGAGTGAPAQPQGEPGGANQTPPVDLDVTGGAGAGDAQGAGDDGARQSPVPGAAPDPAAAGGQTGVGPVPGTGQTDQAGLPQNTGPTQGDNLPLAGTGNTGQTSSGGQPAGPSGPPAAAQAGSGGGTGAAPTERHTDGGGTQAPSETVVDAGRSKPSLVAGVTLDDARAAYNALTTKQREDIRAIGGVKTSAAPEFLLRLLDEGQPLITRLLAATRSNAVVRARREQAVLEAANYLLSPEYVSGKIEAEERAAVANEGLIRPIARADTGLSKLQTSNIASLARTIYGLEADNRTLAATLLADVAGAYRSAPELVGAVLESKLDGTGKPLKSHHVDNIINALSRLSADGVLPDEVELRSPITDNQLDHLAVRAVVDAADEAQEKVLVAAAKHLTGKGGRGGVRHLMRALVRAADASSVDTVAANLNNRIRSRDAAAAAEGAFRQVMQTRQLVRDSDQLRAEEWIRNTDPSVYADAALRVVTRMNADPDSQFSKLRPSVFKATTALTGENVVSAGPVANSRVVNLRPIADTLAYSVGYAARLGEQHLSTILRMYGGQDHNGVLRVSDTAAEGLLRIAGEVKQALKDMYLAGQIQEPAAPQGETQPAPPQLPPPAPGTGFVLDGEARNTTGTARSRRVIQLPDENAPGRALAPATRRSTDLVPAQGTGVVRIPGDELDTELASLMRAAPPATLEELDAEVQLIASSTGLPVELVYEWLESSPLLTKQGITLDAIYDMATGVWRVASEGGSNAEGRTVQIEGRRSLEGARALGSTRRLGAPEPPAPVAGTQALPAPDGGVDAASSTLPQLPPPIEEEAEATLAGTRDKLAQRLSARYGKGDAGVMADMVTKFFERMAGHYGTTPDAFAAEFAPDVRVEQAMADVANKVRTSLLQAQRPDTKQEFERRIDELFSERPIARRQGVIVLDRTDILDMLGFGDFPLQLAENKVLEGRANHPAMTAEVWKKLPEWVDNPAFVFDSDTVQDGESLAFIAPELVDGSPVRIIIRKDGGVDAHLLLNAYDTPEGTPFIRWTKDRLLRYADTKKAPQVDERIGLRLPELLTNPDFHPSAQIHGMGRGKQKLAGRTKILTEKNLAGYRKRNPFPDDTVVLNQGDLDARRGRGKNAKIRGAYTPARNLIELFESADPSTFVHEFAHYAFDTMVEVANRMGENAPAQLLRDIDTLLAHGGTQSLEQWNATPLADRRDTHETIARSFEAYLFEGATPSPEVEGIFARLKELMRTVYNRVRQLKVKLTPEVRNVFDRMFAETNQQETNDVTEISEGTDNDSPQSGAVEPAADGGAYSVGADGSTDDATGAILGEGGRGDGDGSAEAAGQGDAQGPVEGEGTQAGGARPQAVDGRAEDAGEGDGGDGRGVGDEQAAPQADQGQGENRPVEADSATIEAAVRNAGLTKEENRALWADESVRNPLDELDDSTPAERFTTLVRDLLSGEVDPENALQASATRKMRDYIANDPNVDQAAAEAAQARIAREDENMRSRQTERAAQDTIADILTDAEYDAVDNFLYEHGMDSEGVADFIADTLAAEATGERLDSIQQKALRALKAVFDKVRRALHSFAMVSLATAGLLGTSMFISPDAMAAADVSTPLAGDVVMTSAAKATLDEVLARNDNEGRPFVIADKKSGMMYTMNAAGEVVNITPALFGMDTGDTTTAGSTPAGRFDLSYNTDARLPSGYQGSVQAFGTGAGGELFAIHRVLDLPGQNRPGRLASATGRDNRVTMGCINIPADVYDKHFDGDTGAVLYVLPDSSAWDGSLYRDPAREVSRDMQSAQREPVKVPAESIWRAPPPRSVRDVPVTAHAPVVVQGQQSTGQYAMIQPLVLGGVSFSQMDVPAGVHTPAEQAADGSFDTAPIPTPEGELSLADAAVAIVTWLGAGGIVWAGYRARKRRKAKRKEFLESKKKRAEEKARKAEEKAGAKQDDAAEAEENFDLDEADIQAEILHPADAAEDNQTPLDEMRAEVEPPVRPKHIPKNMQGQPDQSAEDVFLNRADWLRFYEASGGDSDFGTAILAFDDYLGSILSDETYAQARRGDFDNSRRWSGDETDPYRAGLRGAFMRFAGGATTVFDNWTKNNGVAVLGHEADSSAATVALAGIKTRAAGARSYIHRNFIRPLEDSMMATAGKLRMSVIELETDVGELANVRHVLNEAADALFAAKQARIDDLQKQLDSRNDSIARTAADSSVRPADVADAARLQNEIDAATQNLKETIEVYEGRKPWDNKEDIKMPGGYTRADAEKVVSDLEAKYGDNFALVEQGRKQLVAAIQGVRKTGTAHGVHSGKDLDNFARLGFKDYVPLYRRREDPRKLDTLDDETQISAVDQLLRTYPRAEALSMGLAKDLTRFAREGASEPAADAFTNFRMFSYNMAGRIGQKQWEDVVQQMYEGTTGRDISASVITDPDTLLDINRNGGKLPGLIRVTPGAEKYLDSETQAKIKDAKGNAIRPIRAKGYNAQGELVDYHYYFTERAIQQEVYGNMEIAEELNIRWLRDVGSLTRVAARLMTTYKPVWNLINMARDSIERLSIMVSRPVKDQNGELIPRTRIAMAYSKNLAKLAGRPSAMGEVYRYIATGEVKTPLQHNLREAERNGAITLMTSLTARSNILNDLQRSDVDRLARRVGELMGTGINKTGLRGLHGATAAGLEFYVEALTETSQVMVALAAYNAYKELGVNNAESANRVRDQYDPLRTNNPLVRHLGPMFPFVRSTLSGHYNLSRTLTEYWRPEERWGQALYLAGGTVVAYIILSMISAQMGDDENGVPLLARLPMGTLMGGIPMPVGDGVYTLPIGFGVPKIMWGTAANLFKSVNGMQGWDDMAVNMAGLAIDNTSPIAPASAQAFSDNPVGSLILTSMPTLVKPIAESALNLRAYGGGRVYGREAGPNQRDSDVDDFNTPEVYKKLAKALYEASGGFFDVHPGSFKHAAESYAFGPFKAVPVALHDRADKTLGYQTTKGEQVGALVTMLGADIGWSPTALKDEPFTWRLRELQSGLHRKYGVQDKHSEEDYAAHGLKKGKGSAEALTAIKMRKAGASDQEINFVVESMKFAKAKTKVQKSFRDAAMEYYNARQQGEDDPALRRRVEALGRKLEALHENYLRKASHAYLPLSAQ